MTALRAAQRIAGHVRILVGPLRAPREGSCSPEPGLGQYGVVGAPLLVAVRLSAVAAFACAKVGEDALSGSEGRTLKRLPAHRAFWFCWYAAYPETRLVE